MFDGVLIALARILPRGGFRLLQLAATFSPRLRQYPVTLSRLKDLTLRCDLRDRICFPLIKYGYYPHQVAEEAVFAQLCAEARCIVDVGANIGYTAILFAQSAPNAAIFTFEPARKCQPYLAQVHDLFPQVVVFASAVSDHAGEATFLEQARLDLSHLGSAGDRGGQRYSVPLTTLDAWRESHPKIDFLKIDVEGFEREVLSGAQEILKCDRPVVAYEALTSCISLELLDIFRKSGYEVRRVSHHGRVVAADCQGTDLTNNYIAVPCERAAELTDMGGSL